MDKEPCDVAIRLEVKLDAIHENIGSLRAEVKALGSKQAWASVVTSAMIASLISALSKLIPGFPHGA